MVNWKRGFDIKRSELCFGCGKKNPIGLKLDFKWDGRVAQAEFTPTELHQGWSGIMHGGIISSLLDEAMAYAAIFEGVHCLTAKMETRIKRPVPIDEPLLISSWVSKKRRKVIEAQASLNLKDGTLLAQATSSQFVVKS